MSGNTEEKEKCLEKLNQMQKYLPFLDFMIDKIKKKNSEISLECQLSKFELLRSMIAEKNGKYTWDVVLKVEDIIEKLISKLEFKDSYENSVQSSTKTDTLTNKTSMATSVPVVPTTTTADSKSQENSVGLIMKTLKMSADSQNTMNKESSDLSLSTRSVDESGKTMETDLDKDLDGFDLTDCPVDESGTEPKSVDTVALEKPPNHDDLLSSSREKLLKSLQSRLFPGGIPTSMSSHLSKNESLSSAFSRNQTNVNKCKSDISESSEHVSVDKNGKDATPVKSTEKKNLVVSKPLKSGSLSDKSRADLANASGDFNLKQKLKEKLSTVICEVYKVPGKSVGGSLRSLKESKDHKKNSTFEEEELFKPDKLQRSRSSTERKDSVGDRPCRDSSQSEKKGTKSEQPAQKPGSSNTGNKKSDDKSHSTISTDLKNSDSKSSKDEKPTKKSSDKYFELSKLNDDELLGFVKENVQSFPHLAKMKLPELKQAVQSSLVCKLAGLDIDAISEISEDSFQDMDEVVIGKRKPSKNESKEVANSDSKLKDVSDVSGDENLNDEDYALKLIEDTTPKTYPPKKKKGLLELPMPITDDLFNDISSIESFESFKSPPEIKDPRVRKSLESKKLSENKPESNSEVGKVTKEILTYTRPSPQLFKDSSHSSRPQPDKQRVSQEVNHKPDQFLAEPTTTDPVVRTTSSYPKPHLCYSNPRRNSQSSSEAKSYAEYKRRKLKEQEKGRFKTKNPEVFRLPNEKKDSGRNNLQDPRRRDSLPVQTNLRTHGPIRTYEKRKSDPLPKRKSQEERKKEEEDKAKKNGESEELVSPLEELYSNEITPKTGRGYGLQHFKIPKKGAHSSQPKKNQSSSSGKKNGKNKNSSKGTEKVVEVVKEKEKETKEVKKNDKEKETKGVKENEKEEKSEEVVGISKEKETKGVKETEKEEKSEEVEGISKEKETKEVMENEKEKNSEEIIEIIKEKRSKEVKDNDTDVIVIIDKESEKVVKRNIIEVIEITEKEPEVIEIIEKEVVSQADIIEPTKEEPIKSDNTQVDFNLCVKNNKKVSESCQKTNSVKPEIISVVDSSEKLTKIKLASEPESITAPADTSANIEPEVNSNTEKTVDDEVEEQIVFVKESKKAEETMKKVEAQVVECDSSMEASSMTEQTSEKDSPPAAEKTNVLPKEEITQEFVEALIRKSFQSGEGKLLLAQVKLFEKFAKKLDSKKLKTIQKIINSESESSSSASEGSSEDERKKKKGKKSEEKIQKTKKRKKKGKNRRRKKSSSSSSSSLSSESEETSEEEICNKKIEKSDKKADCSASSITGESDESKISETTGTSEESKPKSSESSGTASTKSRKRRRNHEFLRNFGGRKAKRKRKQKKLLEQMLNEGPQPEVSNDSNENSLDTVPKEPERKTKQKPKGKVKTELDRLHEDIRSMFISEGVVTATGQRMCRILKQSGGNMNNLDIVKESAKMVEEEKLKKGHTRSSLRTPRLTNTGSTEDRSRSQSSEKGKGQQEFEEDPKLALEPRVALQRVNLDKFGYGIKISDDCISFHRMKGGNTAIRRSAMPGSPRVSKPRSSCRNVFLERNIRKFELLKYSDKKKSYHGKKLADVVKNLPLKMAKMKHLQIYAKDEEGKGKKESAGEEGENKIELTSSELLNYAFEKKRNIYPCLLCNFMTRNIAGHYKLIHPESEVLISRLSLQEAKKAKLEAEINGYGELDDQPSPTTSNRQRVKTVLRRGTNYNCRMCRYKTLDFDAFLSHVSNHTGEHRYKCPSAGCSIYRSSDADIKFHILTKHARYRNELTSKITELYEVSVDQATLFGFLCSKCNFVQISRQSVEKHISNQHKDSEKATIIKINLSGKRTGPANKRKVNLTSEKSTETKESNKRKRESENDIEVNEEEHEKKKMMLNKTVDVEKETEKKPEASVDDEVDVEKNESTEEEDESCSMLESDDCPDLRNISELKGSDIMKSVENPKRRDSRTGSDLEDSMSLRKIKVGPLEAQLLENAGVLYECYVKGCLFSTRVYDLFQKHIKISHWKTKWNGECEICSKEKKEVSKEGAPKLLTALKHLKLHERERFYKKKTPEESIAETNSPEECVSEDKDSDKSESKSINQEEEAQTRPETTAETSFPAKPLLRVRNFLGDRLSTPKADENVAEEESAVIESMFTIENVRSLTESPADDSGLKIQQVCSLKEPIPQPGTEKTIVVRPCPSRAIPIRPKPPGFPVDVGHINMVRPQGVVLSPISNNAPIRILSTKPKFSVKPIIVPPDTVCLSGTMMPVIRPTMSPTAILPVTEAKKPSENSAKVSLEVEKIASPSKSPSQVGRSSLSDQEETDKKDSNQRMNSGVGSGKKSVKDAKIYQEMLTKTKLCHLFKCMGIECSFTCNDEKVFTQHIGLHEAQRRLVRSKGMKTFRLANKTTQAYHWQQCAYCCEVLSNTNNALSQHILEEHGHCMYQCAFCFYRALSHSYVEIHQNLAHSHILKTTPRLIYKCRPLKVPPSQAAALEKHGRRQSVRPYHCDQCGRNFFITNEFTTHLSSEHQSVTAYTCHICKNLCFKVNRLINHYKLHSYSTYQCAYCLHGTESEKEMVFHLSNFHFSQPAVMYVRALAEGQSDEEKQKFIRKKKNLNNQLDSLKVIVYESDTLSADCVVEVEPEEETTENVTSSSIDLSLIVAELGINTDIQSPAPLIQELASIGDKTAKNLTVKTLLPNAQFSSENETGIENCSVLISSGLSIPSDQNDEKELSIPLGQLPLEAVNIQHKEPASPEPPPPTESPPDRNLKLNEIIVNRYCKSLASAEEEKIGQSAVILSTAVHKLPPVVLTRTSVSKSPHSSKCTVRKKSEEQAQNESSDCDKEQGSSSSSSNSGSSSSAQEKTAGDEAEQDEDKNADSGSTTATEHLITNVVSLCGSEFEKETTETPIVISNFCSLSGPPKETKDKEEVVTNIKSTVNTPTALEPPIIRVEDFPIDENVTPTTTASQEQVEESPKDDKPDEKEDQSPPSPDVIILEEQRKSIVTVTLDSDDENEECLKADPAIFEEDSESLGKDDFIRKEMELLRKQMANETDLLLNDEPEVEKATPSLTLDVEPDKVEKPNEKTLLSPIEEAICSLNKKLQSETEEAQKKEEEEKKEQEESSKKTEENEIDISDRPRTRFGSRDRRREGGDEKNEDEANVRKDEGGKGRKFKENLVGKDLFICGNEKCNFAADDDVSLKDHLFVCDLSRESSVLMCPHCPRQIKQFHPYIDHLRYHGEKKYHCGLCSFSSAVDASAARHVRQKHKCSLVKFLPKESNEGHFVYYPKNYKVDKIDFEANGYSPGDEDKLPLQSVYQVNVKCAKCPYFTKVRSNMVRHLKIHVKSVETEGVVVVPSTAPTNPVPCLETKERMFDKMTNLAASSQLAQAKEKSGVESLSPEEEAKLPQFVVEQMRYKCCLPDCNYITVDDGMLRHHIKALHDEINYYSCPHCQETVHADVRHVTLDKIGHHLKHHDSKLYKCAHCIYFHYQKNVVEKHTIEKHPDKRYYVHTVREPKPEVPPEEESPNSNEGGAKVWKCALCDEFKTPFKQSLMDHLLKNHNTKSKYKCQLCQMRGNSYQAFANHFSSKHPGEKLAYSRVYHWEKVACLESGNSSGADSSNEHFDTTPLWQRGAPRIRHIRGILIEEEEIKTKKSKRISTDESEAETSNLVKVKENSFYCPLCTYKKKPFYTRSEDHFRTHLYQELNYQQFACILCGKMFVDRKDFEKHHSKVHADKPRVIKQTKEDHEIKFWVDQVIAKRKKQMEERKRKLSESETSQVPPKKKKEV